MSLAQEAIESAIAADRSEMERCMADLAETISLIDDEISRLYHKTTPIRVEQPPAIEIESMPEMSAPLTQQMAVNIDALHRMRGRLDELHLSLVI